MAVKYSESLCGEIINHELTLNACYPCTM